MKAKSTFFKIICSLLIVLFTNLTFSPLARAASLNLPAPNQFIPLSKTYSFPLIRGLKLDPLNPFKVEFIVDTADKSKKTISKQEASSLIKYFLAGLTIPEKDIWVNLSPYEKNRVIPESTAATDLGKGLLSQDYILKQLLSSLTYPESKTGKDFWNKTYKEMSKTADINSLSVDTFNKIWIVPDKAVVHQNNNTALITKASLKAMLEEDYLALEKNLVGVDPRVDPIQNNKMLNNGRTHRSAPTNNGQINKIASRTMKETILPLIEKEVNQGKNFANLRQIYHSLILGIWFKKKFQDSVYKHYINKNLIKGIDLKDRKIKDKIYSQYLKAFQKGLYDYIKSDPPTPRLRRAGYEPASNKQVKRRYYSGGITITPGFSLASSSGISAPLAWMAVEQGISSPMARDSFMGNPLNIPAKIVGVDGEGEVLTVRQGKDSTSSSIDNELERFQAHLPDQRISMSRRDREPSIEMMITAMEEFFSERGKDEFSRTITAVDKKLVTAAKITRGQYLVECPLGDIFLNLPDDRPELVFSIDSPDESSLKQLTLIFLRLLGYGYAGVESDAEDKIFPFISMDSENHDELFKLFGYHQQGELYANVSGNVYETDELEDEIAKFLIEIFPEVINALNKLVELSIQASSGIMSDGPVPEGLFKDSRKPNIAAQNIPLSKLKVVLPTEIQIRDVKDIESRIKSNMKRFFRNGANSLAIRNQYNPIGAREKTFMLVDSREEERRGGFELYFGNNPMRYVSWEWFTQDSCIYPRMIITINTKNKAEAIILKNVFVSLSLLSMRQVANRKDRFFEKIKQFEVITESGEGKDAANKGVVPSEFTVYEDTESLEYTKVKEALESLNNLVSSSSLNKEEAGIKQADNGLYGGIALKDISSRFEAQENSFTSSPAWNTSFEAGELKGFSFDMGEIEQIRDLEEVFSPARTKKVARWR